MFIHVPQKDGLNLGIINALIAECRQYKNDGLAYATVDEKCKVIEGRDTLADKVKAAEDLIDWLNKYAELDKYRNAIIDFRVWDGGDVSPAGQTVGDCPVCGKRGELNPPYPPSGFMGETFHVYRVIGGIGVAPLLICDWETRISRTANEWNDNNIVD